MICTTGIPSYVVCWTVSPSSNGKNFGGELLGSAIVRDAPLTNSHEWGVWHQPHWLSTTEKVKKSFTGRNAAVSILVASDGVPVKVGFARPESA